MRKGNCVRKRTVFRGMSTTRSLRCAQPLILETARKLVKLDATRAKSWTAEIVEKSAEGGERNTASTRSRVMIGVYFAA
jgi:hypothetical protein